MSLDPPIIVYDLQGKLLTRQQRELPDDLGCRLTVQEDHYSEDGHPPLVDELPCMLLHQGNDDSNSKLEPNIDAMSNLLQASPPLSLINYDRQLFANKDEEDSGDDSGLGTIPDYRVELHVSCAEGEMSLKVSPMTKFCEIEQRLFEKIIILAGGNTFRLYENRADGQEVLVDLNEYSSRPIGHSRSFTVILQ